MQLGMVEHVLNKECRYDRNEYKLEEMDDNDHSVKVHCGRGFLHSGSTKKLRDRMIHVSATAKMEEEWPLSIFLTDVEKKNADGDVSE